MATNDEDKGRVAKVVMLSREGVEHLGALQREILAAMAARGIRRNTELNELTGISKSDISRNLDLQKPEQLRESFVEAVAQHLDELAWAPSEFRFIIGKELLGDSSVTVQASLVRRIDAFLVAGRGLIRDLERLRAMIVEERQ